LLYQVAGEQGAAVAKAILEEELTDDELAKRVGLQINLVRKILYDFYENRIAVYRRTRDEKSGWYIYHWKLDPQRAIEYLKERQLQLLHKLEEALEKEKNTLYFSCNDGCQKVSYDIAIENDFKCPKCGKMLKQYDNSAVISSIERRVEAIRKKLGLFGVSG
ncbi:MAG: transcription factor E, partial [Candidatus Hadarchaeales archaeon]